MNIKKKKLRVKQKRHKSNNFIIEGLLQYKYIYALCAMHCVCGYNKNVRFNKTLSDYKHTHTHTQLSA